MTFFKTAALAPLAFLFLSLSAQAEVLQTWRVTATTYQVEEGFTPPSFAEIGQDFFIDYVIDTDTPWSDTGYNCAIKSMSVNGMTSASDGYVASWAGGALKAINVEPVSGRTDGITFISFNNFSGVDNQDLGSMLADFAAAAPTTAADLRLDFGVNSIRAHTSSFVMTSGTVPEPSSVLLMLIGLPLLMLRRYGSRRAGAYTANSPSSLRALA